MENEKSLIQLYIFQSRSMTLQTTNSKKPLEKIHSSGCQKPRSSDVGANSKSMIQSPKTAESKGVDAGMERLFAPSHEFAKSGLIRTFQYTVNVGMGVILLAVTLILLFVHLFDLSMRLSRSDEVIRTPRADAVLTTIALEIAVSVLMVWGFHRWVEKRVDGFRADQVWKSERWVEREKADAHIE